MMPAPTASDSPDAAKPQSSLLISIEGFELQLLAGRGVFWPAQNTLFIADTHFGKEATFRSHGVAAPRGSTQATLVSIEAMISQCPVTRLVILGDMFHARSSISHDIQDSLDQFFAAHAQVRVTLVLGNHDRGIDKLIGKWPIEIVDSGTMIGAISVAHFPQPAHSATTLLLCGHLHPAYRFATKTDTIGKLPCFWLSNRQLVLPAIGAFTGTKTIQPGKADQTWIIVDGQIVRL